MQSPLFLKPVLQERIWGGNRLQNFNYELSSEATGECWGISAHPNGKSVIREGKYKDIPLEKLWRDNRELFGNYPSEEFPLLTKILDVNQYLSVQVHPNDKFASMYEQNGLGKTECWYIIDCKEDAEIIYGHYAKTREEFMEMIEQEQWNQLLRHVPIKPGDFFYVPSGTIHAICGETLILETQQSSDITYRVYDYDRIDKDGGKRELHLDKAIAASTVPHQDVELYIHEQEKNGVKITTFVQGQYFSIYKWEIEKEGSLQQDKYFQLASVIEGEGRIKTADGELLLRKGDHFILPATLENLVIIGKLTIIASHP